LLPAVREDGVYAAAVADFARFCPISAHEQTQVRAPLSVPPLIAQSTARRYHCSDVCRTAATVAAYPPKNNIKNKNAFKMLI